MIEIAVQVVKKNAEADGICSFELVALPGHVLPEFAPGAHIDVHLPQGLVRQYSLCNDPVERDRWRIAVLREAASRGGSAAMHEIVKEGDSLRVSKPRNLFGLSPVGHSLLLAGGIGVTPLLSMAQALHRADRDFAMHYCARTANRMAFRPALELAAFAKQVHFHVDDGDASQRLDVESLLRSAAPGTHLYVCGPGGFMEHVLSTARRVGWPEDRLHKEHFAAAPIDASADGEFEVQLARTGKHFKISATQTVLDVLLAEGIDVPSSCEAGVCGTCLTRVLAGAPDHRDSFLTDKERLACDQFTPCCSRSLTPVLVLDL